MRLLRQRTNIKHGGNSAPQGLSKFTIQIHAFNRPPSSADDVFALKH